MSDRPVTRQLQPRLSYGAQHHTGGNAVIRLVRRHVVDAVVFPWQHQMPVLEQRDPSREAKVGVAPLVDLIG